MLVVIEHWTAKFDTWYLVFFILISESNFAWSKAWEYDNMRLNIDGFGVILGLIY